MADKLYIPRFIQRYEITCKKNHSSAFVEITYYIDTGMADEKRTIKLPVVAAWPNPVTGTCVVGHFAAHPYNEEHRLFFRGVQTYQDGLSAGVDEVRLSAHQNGKTLLLRVGPEAYYKVFDNESQQSLQFFHCKQTLVRGYVEFLRGWNAAAGVDLINWECVPDEVLQGWDCIKIEDILRRSQPMWACEFSHVMQTMNRRLSRDTAYNAGRDIAVIGLRKLAELVSV